MVVGGEMIRLKREPPMLIAPPSSRLYPCKPQALRLKPSLEGLGSTDGCYAWMKSITPTYSREKRFRPLVLSYAILGGALRMWTYDLNVSALDISHPLQSEGTISQKGHLLIHSETTSFCRKLNIEY